ncbi:hypothetical protein [Clostridium sardiniense]|uniref:hypothetical protein n=1 Tax=Clostridium sardiniense TaxID=29369 RepID=UPI003D33B1C4
MIRTVVCQKEGCSGNKFQIETIDNNIQATCRECGSKYLYEAGSDGYEILSTCVSCKNDTFKLFRDINANKIYCKCSECGDPPERIFIDADGIQIPYETKLLQDLKNHMHSIDQRLCNLDIKIENLDRGQSILEESLAYINKYIVEQS